MNKKLKKTLITMLSLVVAISTFTITWRYVEALEGKEDTGLELDKTVTDNGDGTYTISLEAYTTGTVTTITKSKPTDIVLVLDQSGSMGEQMSYTESYYPIYADGTFMEAPDPSTTYYLKDTVTDEWKPVTFSGEMDYFRPEFKPIYIYQDSDGNKMAPLKKDGTAATNLYPSVQLYRLHKQMTGPTKLESLKKAASTFVNNVVTEGGDHRIAVVGFANGEGGLPGDIPYQNTDLFIGNNKYNYNSSSINGQYGSAFQSVKTNSSTIRNSINSLLAYGSTRADLGMEMANKILANDPLKNDSTRNKIIVMFTDGEPTNTNGFDDAIADKTIAQAKQLKDSGAKVFTVGVVDTLDNKQDPATSNKLNRYMQYVSSNYPNATSLSNGGTDGDYLGGHFLYATDEQSLIDMFTKIQEEISSSTSTLDETSIFKDIMSDYFKTPDVIDIKTYTSECIGQENGEFTWAIRQPAGLLSVDVDKSTGTIDVTGFNYKENFVAVDTVTQKPRGKKLIVEFKTTAKDGFIGGNQVPTNSNLSGMYIGDELFQKFPEPSVDIDVKFDLSDINSTGVYLGSSLNDPQNLFDADLNQSGMQYKIGNATYTIDGINNAFVDIVYTIKNEKNEVIGEYKILAGETIGNWTTALDTTVLTENTKLQINAKVTSTTNVDNNKSDIKNGTIYVYTPKIVVEDEVIFLGEKINPDTLIKNVTWVNKEANAILPTMEEPTLTYQFTSNSINIDKETYQPSSDASLSIKVLNGNKDITANSDIKDSVNIQVVSGELTITKNIDKQYTSNTQINANQSFVFRIYIRDSIDGAIRETIYQTIDFSANQKLTSKSITLVGLSKGYYTVTEESNWSWKYEENTEVRQDNYSGNGNVAGESENSLIFIGDRTHTDGKKFFGSATGTVINKVDQSNPANVSITNNIKDTNILGDAANAINQFTGTN